MHGVYKTHALPFPPEVLEVLRHAFVQANQGVVLIDADMVVRFVNAKARALWRLRPEQCDSNPSFSEFIYDIAAAGAYDVDPDALEEYVLRRFASVQSGDETPVDIRLAGNRTVRAQCTVLPDGCRLITYTEITDLVLRADYLQQLANVDVLTGLPNRGEFLRQGEAEWHRFRRYHHSFCVANFDIDHFHAINDEFGIDIGNRALLHVAAVCLREKRNTDLVARFGADKFAVLMPNTARNEARVFAERLRTAVACHPLYLDERPIRLTVSVGVAQSEAEMSGIAALMKSADEFLCIAKERSRNTLVHAANDTVVGTNLRGEPSASVLHQVWQPQKDRR